MLCFDSPTLYHFDIGTVTFLLLRCSLLVSPLSQPFLLFEADYTEPNLRNINFFTVIKTPGVVKLIFISPLSIEDLIWNFSYVWTVNEADCLHLLSLLQVPLRLFLTHILLFISLPLPSPLWYSLWTVHQHSASRIQLALSLKCRIPLHRRTWGLRLYEWIVPP